MVENVSRISKAAIALIKASIDGEPKYLLQWNDKWKSYNFISGKHEPEIDGHSLSRTAIREIEEELSLKHGIDFDIRAVLPDFIDLVAVSKRLGQKTLYRFRVYELLFLKPIDQYSHLWEIGQPNRWFTKKQLIEKAGENFVSHFPVSDIDARIPGGLESLPDSTSC